MQKLTGRVRAAVQKYGMIEDGDVIAVGLSGGKDSVALLCALAALREYYPKRFEVKAITADLRFDGVDTDLSALQALCGRLGVEYIVRRTQLAQIIFEERQESNPCSLCAKMRRGVLHAAAKEAGCSKLALGHHMDDAVETFLMNLLRGGRIDCFSPVTYLSKRELTVIRPLILAEESLVAGAVKRAGLPVVKSKCPMDKTSERAKTKQLVRELNRDYDALREKILGAMEKGGVAGWDAVTADRR